MDALRRTILYPFKASVPETYWKVCRLINALFLDLEIEVPVMDVSTGESSVSYGVAHGYLTVGLNKEMFSEFSSAVSYQNIKLPVDISNVVIKYSRLHPVLSATDMPYNPSTAVSGYTVVMPGVDNFGAGAGTNSAVTYIARSLGNSTTVGTLTYRAHPGYGKGRYTEDPWSKKPWGDDSSSSQEDSVFTGIKSINGLNLNHNVNIKESSEVLRVLEASDSEIVNEDNAIENIASPTFSNPISYIPGISDGLGFYLTEISVDPAAQSISAKFSVESAPIHFKGDTEAIGFGSSSLYIRKYVDFITGEPADSSSSVTESSSSIIESSSSIVESSSSYEESSSSEVPESSSSYEESSSSIVESSSSYEESSSSATYEYLWFEGL